MELWDFAKIMAFVRQQVEEEKSRNRRLEGQEFPDYERQQELLSGAAGMERFPFRELSTTHILLLEHSLYLDLECYQQRRSSHQYQFWSYIPGRKMPCLLFQASQNRNLSHRHDFTEMVYVCSGTYTTEIEGEICVFGERDLCLLHAGCEHREIELECEGIFLYLGFRPGDYHAFWKKNLKQGMIRNFLLSDHEKEEHTQFLMLSLPETCVQAAENYFACMFRELFAQESLYDESCRIWIIRFLNFLEDNGTGKRETLLPDHQPVLLYRKICEYIREHLDTVNIAELKEKFYYQEDYYNRLFQKIEGQTFQSSLMHQRIARARELLLDTGLSVPEIMRRIGYQSKPHFYRCFQAETGMTPAQFRKGGPGKQTEEKTEELP